MTESQPTLSRTTPAALSCAVVARGSVRAPADSLNGLKSRLVLPSRKPLPAALLKHSDEQTVAAVAAVLNAIATYKLEGIDFRNWAVLAAPRFLGRQALAHTLQRFAAEGAWGISPHVIPHRILHAVSGTISLALQIHGPNFGVDGSMPGGSDELLGTALAVLSEGRVPGVWAVMTGWHPEPVPQRPGQGPVENGSSVPQCAAAALALVPLTTDWRGLRLEFRPAAMQHPAVTPRNGSADSRPFFGLEAFMDTLARADEDQPGTSWRLYWGGSVAFTSAKRVGPCSPEGKAS